MSKELLASKVIIVEEEPVFRGIPSVATSVAGAIGITERGPIGKAVLCTSFDEYQRLFGGFTQASDVALAAMGFFENGGTQLWVVRTVHYDDVSDPKTATAKTASSALKISNMPSPAAVSSKLGAPFWLQPESKLALSVNGQDVDVTFQGKAAQVLSGNTEPFPLADGQTLTLSIDEGPEQTVLFSPAQFADITQARADEIADVINQAIVGGRAFVETGRVGIASDTLGTASTVQIIDGAANEPLKFPTDKHNGEGNVENLHQVTYEEIKALIESASPDISLLLDQDQKLMLVTQATGQNASLQVKAASTANLGFDYDLHQGGDASSAEIIKIEGKNPGIYANHLTVEIKKASSGEAHRFDLLVIEDGVQRESFPNLTLNAQDPRYIEMVINHERSGSLFIHTVDQKLSGTHELPVQKVKLDGGSDGLTNLDDMDFIGSSTGKTGLHALDAVQDLSLLFVPGRATQAMHNAMVQYCEQVREGFVFAVLDPPADQSAIDMVTYVTQTASLENLSEYAAIYWSRVKVLNPKKSVFGSSEQIVVPPSGIICGVYARTDGARPGGVYDPPAGIDRGRMYGVLGFETDEALDERKRDLVYPKRINPLTTGPGLPRFIDGSRTLKGDGNFPYIAERRGVMFIERSLKQGLHFARHKNNTESLQAQVRRTVTAFLLTQMHNGAFRSNDPDKAFFVDMSLNTPTVIFAGKLIVRVGLATNKPAEYIILSLSQNVKALEAELAGEQ